MNTPVPIITIYPNSRTVIVNVPPPRVNVPQPRLLVPTPIPEKHPTDFEARTLSFGYWTLGIALLSLGAIVWQIILARKDFHLNSEQARFANDERDKKPILALHLTIRPSKNFKNALISDSDGINDDKRTITAERHLDYPDMVSFALNFRVSNSKGTKSASNVKLRVSTASGLKPFRRKPKPPLPYGAMLPMPIITMPTSTGTRSLEWFLKDINSGFNALDGETSEVLGIYESVLISYFEAQCVPGIYEIRYNMNTPDIWFPGFKKTSSLSLEVKGRTDESIPAI